MSSNQYSWLARLIDGDRLQRAAEETEKIDRERADLVFESLEDRGMNIDRWFG